MREDKLYLANCIRIADLSVLYYIFYQTKHDKIPAIQFTLHLIYQYPLSLLRSNPLVFSSLAGLLLLSTTSHPPQPSGFQSQSLYLLLGSGHGAKADDKRPKGERAAQMDRQN